MLNSFKIGDNVICCIHYEDYFVDSVARRGFYHIQHKMANQLKLQIGTVKSIINKKISGKLRTMVYVDFSGNTANVYRNIVWLPEYLLTKK